jgi:hypothetical protein
VILLLGAALYLFGERPHSCDVLSLTQMPSIYRHDVPQGPGSGLSKISIRAGKSATTATGNASTMGDGVRRRDRVCWASGNPICPKRMGDHLACFIYRTFSSASPPIPNLSIYDEQFGISFNTALDTYCVKYEMGAFGLCLW